MIRECGQCFYRTCNANTFSVGGHPQKIQANPKSMSIRIHGMIDAQNHFRERRQQNGFAFAAPTAGKGLLSPAWMLIGNFGYLSTTHPGDAAEKVQPD